MISIILIVKNDREIAHPLKALQKHHASGQAEVIVIDASMQEKLLDIKEQYPYAKWIYYQNNTHKKITIPEQRNLGIENAQGDIIVFTDSGCTPDENWLEELVKPIHQEGERVVCGALKSTEKNSFRDYFIKTYQNIKYLEECPTANLAIQRAVFEEVGNFDTRFTYGSDTDFSWRVRDKGIKIRYAPEAIIHMEWGQSSQEYKRAIIYGEARAVLYRKHFNQKRLSKLLTHDYVTIIYPLFIILLPLTVIIPWYPLLLLIPIYKNKDNHPVQTIVNHLLHGYGFLKGIVKSFI